MEIFSDVFIEHSWISDAREKFRRYDLDALDWSKTAFVVSDDKVFN